MARERERETATSGERNSFNDGSKKLSARKESVKWKFVLIIISDGLETVSPYSRRKSDLKYLIP